MKHAGPFGDEPDGPALHGARDIAHGSREMTMSLTLSCGVRFARCRFGALRDGAIHHRSQHTYR
ncbi:hypothetical protein BGLA2_1710038 [Burkholderia gladioli]|nr:hypothetical protein BGLA2_1710038 [Burkholderia gladioli]